jgi:hypothetical protein
MLTDDTPTSYTYADAAAVLRQLHFDLAPHAGGSHRKWRKRLPDGTSVIIGLVEHGSGSLKAYLIRDLVAQLRLHGLIPPGLE